MSISQITTPPMPVTPKCPGPEASTQHSLILPRGKGNCASGGTVGRIFSIHRVFALVLVLLLEMHQKTEDEKENENE